MYMSCMHIHVHVIIASVYMTYMYVSMQVLGTGDVLTRSVSQRVRALTPGQGNNVAERGRRKSPGEDDMQTVIQIEVGIIP